MSDFVLVQVAKTGIIPVLMRRGPILSDVKVKREQAEKLLEVLGEEVVTVKELDGKSKASKEEAPKKESKEKDSDKTPEEELEKDQVIVAEYKGEEYLGTFMSYGKKGDKGKARVVIDDAMYREVPVEAVRAATPEEVEEYEADEDEE